MARARDLYVLSRGPEAFSNWRMVSSTVEASETDVIKTVTSSA
jgi:hypothetical protein